MLGQLIAAGVAGAATYLELDQVFFVPKKSPGRWGIRMIVAAFVLANALLALALYALLNEAAILSSVDIWVRGLLIGAGYLSLVRLKFATLNEQPFGFEFFYDLARTFAYTRINRRVIDARHAGARQLASETSLVDLIEKANFNTSYDSLLTKQEQSEAKAWILRVIEDRETEEGEKKLILADFIQSGSRAGHE
jgi:hypothetical protein